MLPAFLCVKEKFIKCITCIESMLQWFNDLLGTVVLLCSFEIFVAFIPLLIVFGG